MLGLDRRQRATEDVQADGDPVFNGWCAATSERRSSFVLFRNLGAEMNDASNERAS
jgi:hypothetical protein